MEKLKEGDIVMYREEDGTPGYRGVRYKVLLVGSTNVIVLSVLWSPDPEEVGKVYSSFHPDRYHRIDEKSGSDQSGP